MIERQLAQKLLKIVNNRELHDILLEYSQHRITDLRSKLERAEIEEVKGLQASIRELRRFETLRDEVLEVGKNV